MSGLSGQGTGVTPSGPGRSRAEPEEVSVVPTSVPNAGPYSIGSKIWPGTSKVIEECGELLEVAGKLMGSGGDAAHWTGDLRLRLLEELADASAAIQFFAQANLTASEWAAFKMRNGVKGNRFWKWHVQNGGFTRRFEDNANNPASAIEASGQDGATRLDAKHESATRKGDAHD